MKKSVDTQIRALDSQKEDVVIEAEKINNNKIKENENISPTGLSIKTLFLNKDLK